MVRRWVTLDGEITGESEWDLLPIHKCFWCDIALLFADEPCYDSFDGSHEFVTICNRDYV